MRVMNLMCGIRTLEKRPRGQLCLFPHVRMQEEDGHPRARKRVLSRHQICWCPDLGLTASRTVRTKVLSLVYGTLPMEFCYSSPTWLRKALWRKIKQEDKECFTLNRLPRKVSERKMMFEERLEAGEGPSQQMSGARASQAESTRVRARVVPPQPM